MSRSRSSRCVLLSAPRWAIWPAQPAFRAALIRTAADRHRFVLTNHHIVMDGWSLPILLQEIIAGYYGQPLPAAGAVSQVCHLAGRARPGRRPRGLG